MRVAGIVTYEMLINDLLLLTCRVLEMGKNGGGGGPWLGLWEFFVQQAGDTRALSVFPVEGLGDESLVPQVVPERTVKKNAGQLSLFVVCSSWNEMSTGR